ncbi:MAG: bifunctional 3-(3-hydroxy-phenyl)propionate/3-hydroxycinnamic acid hydroxylase [Pseudomonadota bacterium]
MTAPSADSRFDVAVVGCGPTGATLANLLALLGVRVAVLDREEQVYPLPRAVHFDDECMRVCQTVGIATALELRVRVNPGMRFVDSTGEVLLDWPRPTQAGPQGWHASYRLHQPDLESLLRDALTTQPTVTLHTGCRLLSLQQHEDGVALDTVSDATGHRQLFARYVVGCDGARSTVRESLDVAYDDLGFAERWLVVDLILTRERPDLGDHTLQFCNPDQPATYCRNPGHRRRWEFRLAADIQDKAASQPQAIWAKLAPWITPRDAEIERCAVYTFRSTLATDWRVGRALLAGDAAHLTPPFMGQGMCAGIRDAANLAWKLARCVKEGAPTNTLDSYAAERQPHVRSYIETAVRLGGLVNSLDRERALAMAEAGTTTLASLSRRLGGIPADAHPSTGALAAQPRLSDGRRLDDAVGYAPVQLSQTPSSPPSRAGELAQFDGQAHPAIRRYLEQLGVKGITVRPDRYIDAVCEDEP